MTAMRVPGDDIDITELDKLLFPEGKRPSEMTGEDFHTVSATLQTLCDRYGEDRISAMLCELTGMEAQQIRAYFATDCTTQTTDRPLA